MKKLKESEHVILFYGYVLMHASMGGVLHVIYTRKVTTITVDLSVLHVFINAATAIP